MKQQDQDLRQQTLDLITAQANDLAVNQSAAVMPLIKAWLASLEEEDLSSITPQHLASVLLDGFSQVAQRVQPSCQIAPLTAADGHGSVATALLIVNQDMPFLVDSIVMALRKKHHAIRAVFNTVLSVRRNNEGYATHADRATTGNDPLESTILCLLSEELAKQDLTDLITDIQSVAKDAAVVQNATVSLSEKLSSVATAATNNTNSNKEDEGQEVAAFLEWAKNGAFEAFGYAYYRVTSGMSALTPDLPSSLGVLQDVNHPVYGACLTGIPGDFNTLSAREYTLSIVKAGVQSTLHRDQPLDFIGIRDKNAQGEILGEHCFVGLFTRTATATPLARLPFARGKIAKVLTIAGVRREGFRAETFLEILESLPRTEVLEAEPEWLAAVCSSVVSLYKQARTKIFARHDVYQRHLNVLVYLPRERYSASLVEALSQALRARSGACDVRAQTLVADGPLARVYLIANAARYPLDLENEIEQALLTVLDGWHTEFDYLADNTTDADLRKSVRKLVTTLPADYIAATSASVAYLDCCNLLHNSNPTRVTVRIETGNDSNNPATIRLYSVNSVPSLSRILPALHNAGVSIDREQTYALASKNNENRFFITCLTIDSISATKFANKQTAQVAEELFEALFNDEAEDGRLNGLVIEGGLRVREVQLVRAYLSYWRQAGCRFSVRYIADCLRKQPAYVMELVQAFLLRFNPALDATQRQQSGAALDAFKQRLSDINHADTEEILRSLTDLMLATLRTTYFQQGQNNADNAASPTIVFKFDSSKLALLPEPRPYREIFVFSRRFEGVHLRGGPVARGGLRWSDRMEDYRTEVMGLVKAQMVKNAVIVPAGAKGGFVCKMMPQNATRETIAAEGEAMYRRFISGLLDITDNRVQGEIIAPQNTVCYDPADPYLVVAADKGTATFSDIANGIAVERGFWLGDAFASGGSNGYDHKKLGITAKGAWEAVKRHFYEMEHDMNTTPITMVGIGDMSGDVFGNGVLLSRQLKLVAAFDHRHIFIDPTPDVATSFAERTRMFALPRSSWDDYNKDLISAGGGVWPRSARSITLSPQACAALGTSATTVTPEELLHIILLAPVDLFYNGGIGTYIKSSNESHAQVKDRANDAIRVNGKELRCKVVAEGGNLGATQAGRIEFAQAGGRIFTDAIDNSAGVDCSDHEVNAKIWLDVEVNAGILNVEKRNQLLNAMTHDIEALVLRDNTLQTHLLVREAQAQSERQVQDGYAALIASLEQEGALSRAIEELPTAAELSQRQSEGRGLTTPELAVVIAHVKNRLKRILSAQPLVENNWARALLKPYFPAELVATRDPLAHPLANAILATVCANEIVNRCGPLLVGDLAQTYGVEEWQVVSAWAQAWAALNLAPIFDVLDAHALTVPRTVSMTVDARTRVLQKAVTEGVLSIPAEQNAAENIAELTRLFSQAETLAKLTPASSLSLSEDNKAASLAAEFVQASQAIDALEAVAAFLFASLSVTRPNDMDLAQFLLVGMSLRREAGIDTLERNLKLAPQNKSQEELRDYAQQALRRAQQRLLTLVLNQSNGSRSQSERHDAVIAVIKQLTQNGKFNPLTPLVQQQSLEHAMRDVWALCDAASTVG